MIGTYTLLLCLLTFGQGTTSFSEDKIYTNEDLKIYTNDKHSASPSRLEPIIKLSDFNPSFDELHKYIEEKLNRINISEYKIYLNRLSSGMTKENVKRVWGTKINSRLHEQNDINTWTIDAVDYEIGVSLFFENNKLKGWKKISNQRRVTIPKNTKVIDGEYRGLKEDETLLVTMRGCPTLQDAIDGKEEGTGDVVEFLLIRHWRTIQEICDEVGQGCKSCEEVTRKIKR
ncbi:MAG: hypothetical protein HZC48_05545 [Nitrospirae bacterium]|nr:hypothetical protein [Nitrospirota bacterium]